MQAPIVWDFITGAFVRFVLILKFEYIYIYIHTCTVLKSLKKAMNIKKKSSSIQSFKEQFQHTQYNAVTNLSAIYCPSCIFSPWGNLGCFPLKERQLLQSPTMVWVCLLLFFFEGGGGGGWGGGWFLRVL